MKKKILITGATGLIGKALKSELASKGNIISIHLSPDIDSIENLVDDSVLKMKGLDVLIHTAAVFKKTHFGNTTERDWNDTIDINLKAAFFLAQAAARHMNKNGRMIFFSDVAPQISYTSYIPYCISKAGIDSLVRLLAKTLAPNILVNGIAPFLVDGSKRVSNAEKNKLLSKTLTGKATKLQEIIRIVKHLCEDGCNITGQIINLDGGRTLR